MTFRLAPGGKILLRDESSKLKVSPPKMWEKSPSSKLKLSCKPDQFTRSSCVAIRPKTTIITIEHDPACADPGRSRAFALRLHVFDQLDDAPENEQHRPVVGEQVRQPATERTRMVPSRKTMPRTIRTNGPANER